MGLQSWIWLSNWNELLKQPPNLSGLTSLKFRTHSWTTHELQHSRPPCPLPTPRVYPNSCSLNWWCHPTISSSVVPFSSYLQCFSASGSFLMSRLFNIRWPKYLSFSFNISPSNEQPGLISFRMDLLDLLAVQRTLKSLPNTTVQKHQLFGAQFSL